MPLENDSNIENPDAPFTSINVFEIAEEDIDQFVSDWERRSEVMEQQPGFISANLYKSIQPGDTFQLVNVAQFQSYNALVAANNDPEYTDRLSADLDDGPEVETTRGSYRPVASCTHTYD